MNVFSPSLESEKYGNFKIKEQHLFSLQYTLRKREKTHAGLEFWSTYS